jgi:hypothetical protein
MLDLTLSGSSQSLPPSIALHERPRLSISLNVPTMIHGRLRCPRDASRLNGNLLQDFEPTTSEAFDCRFRRGTSPHCTGCWHCALASAHGVGLGHRIGATIPRNRALRSVPGRVSLESQSNQRTVHRASRDWEHNRVHRFVAWFHFVRFRISFDSSPSRPRIDSSSFVDISACFVA